MQHLFWLLPKRLAGRSGPNLDPWDLKELAASGIHAVLSVNDGELCHPTDFDSLGIAYACVPLSEAAPPRPGDHELCVSRLPAAFEFAEKHISAGKTVLVHCRSGKDRTGMFMAYYLVRSGGLSVERAIQEVKRVRPIALSAPGWDVFTREVLEAAT
jgi:protein-tyrosine phosphatase